MKGWSLVLGSKDHDRRGSCCTSHHEDEGEEQGGHHEKNLAPSATEKDAPLQLLEDDDDYEEEKSQHRINGLRLEDTAGLSGDNNNSCDSWLLDSTHDSSITNSSSSNSCCADLMNGSISKNNRFRLSRYVRLNLWQAVQLGAVILITLSIVESTHAASLHGIRGGSGEDYPEGLEEGKLCR